MAETINQSAEATEAARLESLTGMGVTEQDLQEESTEESKEETEETQQSESRIKEESKDKSEEDKSKDEDKTKDKDEKDKGNVNADPSAKNDRPIKAIFTQIKELRTAIDSITASIKDGKLSPAKQEAVEAVDDALKTIAEKRGLDAEGLNEIASALQTRILENLEKSGVLKKDLPAELQEKLKLLDTVEAEQKQKAEVAHFVEEWSNLLPELDKQYPNATLALKSDAKKLMDELSHTKEFHDKDLDYVLFKNRDKFDTLLKVAKNSKSGEAESKQIEDFKDDEDVDLDPENMDPEKMKRYEKKKYAGGSEQPQILG